MAIRIITGKPGGGKSFWSLKEVLEELLYGERVVVTNLPIDLPALNAYIQKNFPDKDIDLHDRVRLLSEEETKFFFCHRSHGFDITIPSDEETKRGEKIKYASIAPEGDVALLRPVFYVIDEAHIHFDARAWMTSGPHLTFYNSQHRKFGGGDEVFFVTQFVGLLDKRCTGFAQEFIECRNYGMERLGFFKGPKGQHVATTTLTPPGRMVPVMNSTYFRLDIELANCYSTTSGVGVSGRKGKPREKDAKGLAWYWSLPFIAALIMGLYFVPDLIGRMALGAVGGFTGAANKAVAGVGPGREEGAQRPRQQSGDVYYEPVPPPPVVPTVYLRGYLTVGGEAVAWLSDGRRIEWNEISEVYPHRVILRDGSEYRFGPRQPKPKDTGSEKFLQVGHDVTAGQDDSTYKPP